MKKVLALLSLALVLGGCSMPGQTETPAADDTETPAVETPATPAADTPATPAE